MSTPVATPHPHRGARSRRAGRRLALTAGLVGSGVLLSGVYRWLGVGIPCPFLLLTGWQCPLCGGTRMGAALLQGDLAAAWSYNAVALVGLGVLALLAGAWTVQWRGGGLPVPPASWRAAWSRVPEAGWTGLWLGGLVVWVVVRNLTG